MWDVIVETNGSTSGSNTSVFMSSGKTSGSNSSVFASSGGTSGSNNSIFASSESHLGSVNTSNLENDGKKNENETETNSKMPTSTHNSPENMTNQKNNSTEDIGSVRTGNAETGTNTGRRLLEDDNSKGSQDSHSQSKDNSSGDSDDANVQNDETLEAEADSAFELFRENEELGDEYSYDYDDYVDESMWGDEEWTEGQHEKMEDYVNIDSHILCTPVSLKYDVQKHMTFSF